MDNGYFVSGLGLHVLAGFGAFAIGKKVTQIYRQSLFGSVLLYAHINRRAY